MNRGLQKRRSAESFFGLSKAAVPVELLTLRR